MYDNSKPAAGVLLTRGRQVLLIRRGAPPRVGAWDIPGGFLEEGERPEDGAVREIREELGVELDPGSLELQLTSVNRQPEGCVLDIIFAAPMPAQTPRAGSDAAELQWFAVDALPDDLAFDATRDILERWRARAHSPAGEREDRALSGALRGARVVDVTGRVSTGMWSYDVLELGRVTVPGASIAPISSIARDGFWIDELRLASLTGTYVETPAHMVPGAPRLGDIAPARLMVPARIMRLPKAAPRTLYTLEDVERHDPGLQPGEALIVATGWSQHWDEPNFVLDAPAFSIATRDWFLAQPLSVLAVDTPVLDCLWWDKVDPPRTEEKGANLLGAIFNAKPDLIAVAPLCALDQIRSDRGTLIALPLHIADACAAPCRAVFLDGVY